MEFVALDFETANADMSSICQIGLVHFKDGSLQEEWKTYVSEHEDLKEHFSELFEEKPVEEEEPESTIPVVHTKKPAQSQVKKTFVPGQKKFGRTKKIG